MLVIDDLSVKTGGKEIIRGLSLSVRDGEAHVVMGPNGSGKTTLSCALAGHPSYETKGKILLDGEDISMMPADERAKKGVFLAFQNPVAVEGVGLMSFIRKAKAASGKAEPDIMKFGRNLERDAKSIKLDSSFLSRDLNAGLSGGEKKKSEILQMLALSPKLAILDEVDSGLDVDALKTVARAIEGARDGKRMFLLITHYANILKYVRPDFVHVMMDGKIVKTGDAKFAKEIERKGYEWMKNSEPSFSDFAEPPAKKMKS